MCYHFMREVVKGLLVYFSSLLLTIGILFLLSEIGFELTRINAELLAGVFTLIISAAAVLFTSVTNNERLMIAAEEAGQLTYLVSSFTIPIIVSLLGLIVSLIAFSFRAPDYIANSLFGSDWILLSIVLWASFGFVFAVIIIVALEYGMAKELSQQL